MAGEATIAIDAERVLHADVGGDPIAGTILFAHGSGSSRHSPRNLHVAQLLQNAGFETVLVDLLTEEEERRDSRTREHRFDIGLLGERVRESVKWLRQRGDRQPLGLFGASTGAAAALVAAAGSDEIDAVVSRGGRPDLAGDALENVTAPTLLLVGGDDPVVLELNQMALARLGGPGSLVVIEGAGHLFEEPGKLERVAALASEWFLDHLGE